MKRFLFFAEISCHVWCHVLSKIRTCPLMVALMPSVEVSTYNIRKNIITSTDLSVIFPLTLLFFSTHKTFMSSILQFTKINVHFMFNALPWCMSKNMVKLY